MPVAIVDDLEVYYEILGSGPPLLMMAPGAFDATIEQWRNTRAWLGLDALEVLSKQCKVIVYDRREAGRSAGRVERLSWELFAQQGKGLLEALDIDAAFVMGGCMGCSVALAFAVDYPEATRALVLHWPVGGYRWRASSLKKFQQHERFVRAYGFEGVLELAKQGSTFWKDSRVGPWGSAVKRDHNFAAAYTAQEMERYLGIVSVSGPVLFDRDTAPGAAPEELLAIKSPALVIPGDDPSHATSAAHYLRECLPYPEFWNVAPFEQNVESTCDKVLDFCSTK